MRFTAPGLWPRPGQVFDGVVSVDSEIAAQKSDWLQPLVHEISRQNHCNCNNQKDMDEPNQGVGTD
ncbi:hypothetical protein [uncultured Marinobacter sp.]|uniref:hypothetical protein n=1 Tax=uncultured Marinobacter sp. TaxID=187379 RepID=UPI0030DA9D6E